MAQVGSTCYGSDAEALQAIASAQVGHVVPAGSVVYAVDAVPSGASSIAYTLTPLAGGSAVTSVVPVVIPPCTLLDWSDGVAVGWGIAGAWILTAVVLHFRQAAHS